MLEAIAADLWHIRHDFAAGGIAVSTRMTVVRLGDGRLWLHSPVPLSAADLSALKALGPVAYVVAPNKVHHLFAKACVAAFPEAQLFGAPGLPEKRPDLTGMRVLQPLGEAEWQDDLEQRLFEGIPLGNETVWFHKATRTLILTDLCQWWQGDLPFSARLYAHMVGVRKQLAVPRTIRLMIRDRVAAQRSARAILQWPFERVIMAHNSIVEHDAHGAVARALSFLTRD